MYLYVCMCYMLFFFLIIWLIIYIFIIKIVFNFKCIHVFAWVTCWFQNRIQKQQFRTKGVVISRHGKTGQNFLTRLELDFFDLKQKHVDPWPDLCFFAGQPDSTRDSNMNHLKKKKNFLGKKINKIKIILVLIVCCEL